MLAGDHGAQSYQCRDRGFAATEDGFRRPPRADCHDVLLAIRCPIRLRSRILANQPGDAVRIPAWGARSRQTAAADDAYLLDAEGLLRTAADASGRLAGRARKGWR